MVAAFHSLGVPLLFGSHRRAVFKEHGLAQSFFKQIPSCPQIKAFLHPMGEKAHQRSLFRRDQQINPVAEPQKSSERM